MRRVWILLSAFLGVGIGVALPFSGRTWIPASTPGGADDVLLLVNGIDGLNLVDDISSLILAE